MLLSAVAVAALGCSMPHLAGTNDAALEYVALEVPASEDAALVAAGIKARLVSGQIPADVEPLPSAGAPAAGGGAPGENAASRPIATVRVVVDAEIAGAVDELLTWRGGVAVYRVDGDYTLAPPDTTAIRPMNAQDPAGAPDRWWQGSAAAVGRAVRQARLDPSHAAFAERLAGGEWRTRVVVLPPVAELGLASAPLEAVEPVQHGRALALTLSARARAALADDRTQQVQGSDRVALARGTTLLGTMPLQELAATPLVLSFGDDVTAYTRAYRVKQLLRSPVLPPLERVSAAPLPPRRGLAAACAVLPFLLSFAWLFFVRRFDRARPEPMWLVAATFALGGLAIVPAALLELGLASLSPWLDPSIVTLGGQPWALPVAIPVFAVTVGLVEEGAKLLGAWSLARQRREFDEPVDGIVYGCAAALGFAAVENVKYFALGRMSGSVIALRAFMTVPAHMFFGAIWGYAMGMRLVTRRTSVIAFLALAALAHGAFDALLSTDGMQLLATLLVLVLAGGFFALLRRALRHGAIPPRAPAGVVDGPEETGAGPASALPRTYLRVGSPTAFYGCAGAMILCAFSLTVLGSAYELLHHRAGVIFVALATTMLALFGLAAFGASATIPLDVAIDAHGLTFAGGRTPWSAILGAAVEEGSSARRAFVRVDTRTGALRLGPASPSVAQAIVQACTARS